MAVDVGSAVGYLDLDISGFLAGLKQANDEADKQTKNLATKIGGNLTNAGKTLTTAGTTLTKNVTVPLLGVGAAGLKVAMNFEKGMSEVKAISGATGKDFDDLRNKAIELGADTAFSANEVAAGMTEMAKAGWTSQQIIDGMGGVLDAAAASGESLANVSTIVADTITGFGMEAIESTRVADLLTQAANSGTIGINDLGESFKYIAPVAGSMGFSIEDVTTALSAMSMSGIKGSQAGTSLRGVLTRMVKPTKDVSKAMKKLGIELTNKDGTYKSLDTIVSDLRGSFEGLTDKQKTYYAAVLAGQEGMSGLLSLLNLSQEEYDEIAKSMDEAKGTAAETAKVMQDNLQSKVEQLGGSLESLAITLADFVIPYIQRFVVWLTGLIDTFTALSPETQKTILKFAGLAMAAGPVILAIGKVVSIAGTLFTAFGKLRGGFMAVSAGGKAGAGVLAKLGGALAGITAPMMIVVGVAAVLAAAFASLWKNNETFRNKVILIWAQVKAMFSSFAQGIVDRLNALGFNFTSIIEVLKAAWQGLCNFLAPIFIAVFSIISSVFGTILDVITGILDVFIGLFTGNWSQLWAGIVGIFTGVWNGIVGIFRAVGSMFLGIFNVVCGWFGTTWSATWDSIKTFFVNTWTTITTFLSNAVNTIKGVISIAFTFVKLIVTSIWNGIQSAIETPFNAAKTTIDTVVEAIKTATSTAFESVKTTATTVWESIKSAITDPIETAKTTVSSAIEAIKGFFNFEWSLPALKMPHFTVSGSFSLNPLSVPHFSIEWYKKAMGNGMILDAATIFGFNPKTGKFLGGGEAGSETIVGTNSLLSMIKQAVYEAVGPLVAASHQLALASAELGYVTYNGFTKLNESKEKQDKTSQSGDGGDTFIFNSPKAIDEIEAAKQLKKTKRELAEGF